MRKQVWLICLNLWYVVIFVWSKVKIDKTYKWSVSESKNLHQICSFAYEFAYVLIHTYMYVHIFMCESSWMPLICACHMYRVSVKKGRSYGWELEEVKENKKVLYHFVNFAIVNELLIIKNCRISPAYWLMQTRDEMQSPCQRDC